MSLVKGDRVKLTGESWLEFREDLDLDAIYEIDGFDTVGDPKFDGPDGFGHWSIFVNADEDFSATKVDEA